MSNESQITKLEYSVGLGTAAFGTSINKDNAFEILDAFIAMGGKVIDTANNYAFWDGVGGESEQTVGEWLSSHSSKDVEIHTKIGAQPLKGNDFSTIEGLSKTSIQMAITRSLARLKTDYVDVLYAHVDDQKVPLEETWTALSELVKSGLVRKLGISNYTAERIRQLNAVIETNKLAPISYAQYRHSVISPIAEADFGVQVCLTNEVRNALAEIKTPLKIVAYSPLLDGAFETQESLPENYQTAANVAQREALQQQAKALGVTTSALVLKQLTDDHIFTLTMTGKMERLQSNLALFTKK